MTNFRFQMRNVTAIAVCLAVASIAFSSCFAIKTFVYDKSVPKNQIATICIGGIPGNYSITKFNGKVVDWVASNPMAGAFVKIPAGRHEMEIHKAAIPAGYRRISQRIYQWYEAEEEEYKTITFDFEAQNSYQFDNMKPVLLREGNFWGRKL